MSITNLTSQQLRQAAELKDKISALENQLSQLVGAAPVVKAATAATAAKVSPVQAPPKKKGTMSAAGKARIIAAQKARWAKIRAAKAAVAKPATKPDSKPAAKGKMTAATKAALSARLKAYWAAKKSGAKK